MLTEMGNPTEISCPLNCGVVDIDVSQLAMGMGRQVGSGGACNRGEQQTMLDTWDGGGGHQPTSPNNKPLPPQNRLESAAIGRESGPSMRDAEARVGGAQRAAKKRSTSIAVMMSSPRTITDGIHHRTRRRRRRRRSSSSSTTTTTNNNNNNNNNNIILHLRHCEVGGGGLGVGHEAIPLGLAVFVPVYLGPFHVAVLGEYQLFGNRGARFLFQGQKKVRRTKKRYT